MFPGRELTVKIVLQLQSPLLNALNRCRHLRPMPEGFYTSLTFYQVAGKPGSDLLGTGNYDSATLRTVSVSFAAKTAGASGGGNGRALYAENCASCHGPNPGEKIANIQSGGDAQKTITAIKKDSGGMKYLSFLTSDEISAIAKWIANPI